MGVPLLLVELCRGLKRDGVVRKTDKGTWVLATDELERLPDLPLVQWLASRETESLPPDLLAHARLASVLGIRVQRRRGRGGAAGAGARRRRARDPARRQHRPAAPDRQRASWRGTGAGASRSATRCCATRSTSRCRRPSASPFTARRTSTIAVTTISPTSRACRRWRSTPRRAGLRVEAARLYLDLAHRANARHAYLEAELLYRQRDREPARQPTPTAKIAGHQGLGLMRFRLGRHDDALKNFTEALELTRKVDARAARVAILLDEGVVLDWTMDWPKSRARSEEADALVAADPSLATPIVVPALFMARGRTQMRQNQFAEAIATFRQAIEAAEKVGDDGYEALVAEPVDAGLRGRQHRALRRGGRGDLPLHRRCNEEHGDMIGDRERAAEPLRDVVPHRQDRSLRRGPRAGDPDRARVRLLDVRVPRGPRSGRDQLRARAHRRGAAARPPRAGDVQAGVRRGVARWCTPSRSRSPA